MPSQTPEPTVFLVEGELTARTVGRCQPLLLSAFHDADAVRLELPNPIKMDVCGVQLIESARKFALAQGKGFALKAPASVEVARLLEGLGLLHESRPDGRAFWLHDGEAA